MTDETRRDAPHRERIGGSDALDDLVPQLYAELRTLAHQRLRRAPHEHSLNTTGLVHAAYLRLVESAGTSFRSHEHVLAIASRVMRNVLVDGARARTASKRGGGALPAELRDEIVEGTGPADALAMRRVLTRLVCHRPAPPRGGLGRRCGRSGDATSSQVPYCAPR